ncbi:hypothetical protein H5J25_16390 [Sphingomonas aliaeris]|uniref:Uncharacterized protein n=1 Tax=Sphingomonas aliaeris TaxID=2759526 RepID=A0A974NU42_9SPHN|nr:hypothetical protein [Sphingomonas aliaeris]QQV76937.1 hypothetical protein H5J25_16390 [Sphingomonas aliaeris]
MIMVIRGVSVTLAVVSTLAYLLALYVATYACYGDSVGCAAGWTARTIVTLVYLIVMVLLIAATRFMLRIHVERGSDEI